MTSDCTILFSLLWFSDTFVIQLFPCYCQSIGYSLGWHLDELQYSPGAVGTNIRWSLCALSPLTIGKLLGDYYWVKSSSLIQASLKGHLNIYLCVGGSHWMTLANIIFSTLPPNSSHCSTPTESSEFNEAFNYLLREGRTQRFQKQQKNQLSF